MNKAISINARKCPPVRYSNFFAFPPYLSLYILCASAVSLEIVGEDLHADILPYQKNDPQVCRAIEHLRVAAHYAHAYFVG